MPVHAEIALFYFALISLISLFITLADKRRARLRRWRVPEAALFWLSVLGGSAAMYAAMRLTHHKTLKRRFMIGIPALLQFRLRCLFLSIGGLSPDGSVRC